MINYITLGSCATSRANNFNLLRMLAATGVLISHAYPVSLGKGAGEPLQQVLGMHLGRICLLVFFAISGFFITKSYLSNLSWRRFLMARALRLFPALLVVLIVTVVVAGAFLTTVDQTQFWSEAPLYIIQNLTLIWLDYDLPGVFEENPYQRAINIPLWTLLYEVICYAGIFFAGLFGILRRPRLFALCWCLALIFCVAMPYLPVQGRLQTLAQLALPFILGSGFFVWRDMIPLSLPIAIGLGLLAWAAHGTEAYRPVFVLALSYGIFVLGYWPSAFFQNYNKVGDYSYGTYIYGFPTQQLIASAGITAPLLNIALALPITLCCAVLSWHFVERVALGFKSGRAGWPASVWGSRKAG